MGPAAPHPTETRIQFELVGARGEAKETKTNQKRLLLWSSRLFMTFPSFSVYRS